MISNRSLSAALPPEVVPTRLQREGSFVFAWVARPGPQMIIRLTGGVTPNRAAAKPAIGRAVTLIEFSGTIPWENKSRDS